MTDNAPCFTSDEFNEYCKKRSIIHLTGAPYHPSTNGAAERLIQTFKQAMRKSSLVPQRALLEFLQQHKRSTTASGFYPSQLLNNRQIRTRIDTLLPSPAHIMQGQQIKLVAASKSHSHPSIHNYKVAKPCVLVLNALKIQVGFQQ